MSAKSFVDTNILIYALDPRGRSKQIRAIELIRDLWATRTGVISTQVLQELCVNARRRAAKPVPVREMEALLDEYLGWEVYPNSVQSIYEALKLEERYQISFWDALILSAAQGAGARTLYSEDFSHGQVYGNVTVVNPFV